jgi:hypothetical protein
MNTDVLLEKLEQAIRELPPARRVARERIAGLASEPRPSRSKELDGHPGYYCLHIATTYRLVWLVDDIDPLRQPRPCAP